MCAISGVIDDWNRPYRPYVQPNTITVPWTTPPSEPRPPTPAEIREFRRLLEEAKKRDKEEGQPDCESVDKIELLRQIAELLGIADEIEIIIKEVIEDADPSDA